MNPHLWGRGEDTETKTGTEGKPDVITVMSSLGLGPGRPRSGFHICAWDFSGQRQKNTRCMTMVAGEAGRERGIFPGQGSCSEGSTLGPGKGNPSAKTE